MNDNNNIITTFNADLLVYARVNEGLSRREACVRVNMLHAQLKLPLMTTTTLFKLENGIQKPTLDILKLFAEVYNRKLAFFFIDSIHGLKAKRDANMPWDANYEKQC